MSRVLWIVAAVLVPLLVLAVPVSVLGAIWVGSWRLAGTAGVLFVLAFPVAFGFLDWTEKHKPEPLLPRADRKRLRAEARRIRLDAELARLEREAGIQ